jgi:nucleoside-specific outer membrane channel protein Tsx
MEPTMKKLTLAALGIIALAALPVSAANWSDTYLGYQYSNQFRDPGVSGNEVKSRTELSGVYGWDYGTNFFDVNMLWASHKDPANTPSSFGSAQAKVPGDTEVYVVYRSNFDLGKIFKTNMAFGPVREVDFTVGFDFDSTDNYFASNKKFVVAGPQFGFNISKGFWNVGVGVSREQNYNGFIEQEVDFKTAGIIWTAWEKTYDAGIPIVWKGWANYIGSKGNQTPGANPGSALDFPGANLNNPTKPETIGDTYLLADISKVFGRKPGAIFIGPGFEYWNNKFGAPNKTDFANTNGDNNQPVHALMLAAEFHF